MTCSGCNGSGTELSGTTYGGLSEEVGCGQCGDDCPADCGCRMTEPDEAPLDVLARFDEGVKHVTRAPSLTHTTATEVRFPDFPAAPAQVPESGAPAAPGATESAPGSPSAWGVPSEAERAMRSERALHAEMGRALTTAVALRQERDDAIAALSEARAERDAARSTAALLEADGARLRERIAAYAATVEDDCQGDLACDVHHVDFVTVGDWRGCAWVADLRALLAEGGEGGE